MVGLGQLWAAWRGGWAGPGPRRPTCCPWRNCPESGTSRPRGEGTVPGFGGDAGGVLEAASQA